MNETTHRFLQTIVGRLPEGRIAELRLFPAIRQGGIESAVAVVAVEQPEVPPVETVDESTPVAEGGEGFAAQEHPEVEAETIDLFAGSEDASIVEASVDSSDVAVDGADGAGTPSPYADDVTSDVVAEAADATSADDDSPYADEPGESLGDRVEVVTVHSEVVVAELADRAAPDAISDALDVEVTRIMADPFNIHSEGLFSLGADDAPLADREAAVGRAVEVDDADTAETAAHNAESGGIADASTEDDGNITEQGIDRDADDLIAARGDAAAMTDREVERSGADVTADAAPDSTTVEESIALGDILALPPRVVDDAPVVSPIDPNKRYAILTASYRLVLKGPDRGKWEVDIIHEADAPLATVERVARGVARRAGDESDPEHFSGDELKSVIEKPSWATSA